MSEGQFRSFCVADRASCLALFDANCPAYFAPNERADYQRFLDAASDGYEVLERAGRVVAAYGLTYHDGREAQLDWIMVDPGSKGLDLGSRIMSRVIARASKNGSVLIRIAASHKSAPFFARFGAVATSRKADGWGPGMHRVDMELRP